MKDWWLKICCFLTGTNYALIKHSSEQSAMATKKYASAILLVLTVWLFIGYSFANSYVGLDPKGSVIVAFVLGFMIIQIERIVIMSSKKNIPSLIFRGILAFVMAIIGAMITDQILFKDDIAIKKEKEMAMRVQDAILIDRQNIEKEMFRLDSLRNIAEDQFYAANEAIARNPMIVQNIRNTSVTTDSLGRPLSRTNSTTATVLENPKIGERAHWEHQIQNYDGQRNLLSERLRTLEDDVRKNLAEKTGFLDELEILKSVIFDSNVGLIVYLLFFIFFLAIELFVLMIKIFDKESDYDHLLRHQKEVRVRMIDNLK